jgi:signal transduction histidine kinase
MAHNLKLWSEEALHLDVLFMTDENGTIHTPSTQESDASLGFKLGKNLSQHPHFIKHQAHPEKEILISPYSKNIENHHILMSHRLEKLDGNFGGLVIAVVDGRFITQLFKSSEPTEHSKIAVFLNRNTLLVDDFELYRRPDFLSTIVTNAPRETNIQVYTQYLNDRLHIIASQSLNNFPIYISMIRHESAFLGAWHEAQRFSYIFLAILLGLGLLTMLFILLSAWQLKKAQLGEEKALFSNKIKSDFLAKMSHELRTPLNAVIGFSRMLKNGSYGPVNQDQKKRLEDIHSCSSHLLELINDILVFSKGEANKIALDEGHVDTAAMVTGVLRIISERALSKNIQLINQAASNMPYLYGDERKLKQITLNLVSNAIKFTEPNGKVTIHTSLDKNRNFILKVEDTGIGIRKEDIGKAMAVFEQVHSNSKLEGTGLGLPICKMFAELHGGKIRMHSTVGKGTVVIVTLPFTRVSIDQPEQLPKRTA